jgi:hypothetical protein
VHIDYNSEQLGDTVTLLSVCPETQFAWKCAALFKRNTVDAVTGHTVQGKWLSKDMWDLCLLTRSLAGTMRAQQVVRVVCALI